MRAVQTFVTFNNSFMLPGVPEAQSPGTYGTVTLEEWLHGDTFTGWNSVSTSFRMPVIGSSGRPTYAAISPAQLMHAMTKDRGSAQRAVSGGAGPLRTC